MRTSQLWLTGSFAFFVAGTVALVACEDETTGGAPPAGTAPTTSVPTTSPTSTGPGTDPDGGAPDGGGNGIPDGPTFKLANLFTDPINACLKPRNAAAFTTPLFPAAIPPSSVSARVAIAENVYDVKILVNTSDCSAVAHQTSLSSGGHVGIFFRGLTPPSGAISGGFFESLTTAAGKETIMMHNGSEPPEEPFFHRDDDAGAPIDLFVGYDKTVPLDGNVVGRIQAGGAARSLRTKSGGALGLWIDGTTIILCDDLAPPKDGLTDCSPAVRAP